MEKSKTLIILLFIVILILTIIVEMRPKEKLGIIDKEHNIITFKDGQTIYSATYAIPKAGSSSITITNNTEGNNLSITIRSNNTDLIPKLILNNVSLHFEKYKINNLTYYVFKNETDYLFLKNTNEQLTLYFHSNDLLYSGEEKVDILFKNNNNFSNFNDAIILDPAGNISSSCTNNGTAYRCNGTIQGQSIDAGNIGVWINGSILNGTVDGNSASIRITTNGSIEIYESTIEAWALSSNFEENFSAISNKTTIINNSVFNSFGGKASFNISSRKIIIDNSTINNYGAAGYFYPDGCNGAHNGGSTYLELNATTNISLMTVIINNYGSNGEPAGGVSCAGGAGGSGQIFMTAPTISIVNPGIIKNYGASGGGSSNGNGGLGGNSYLYLTSNLLTFINVEYVGNGGQGGTSGASDAGGKGGVTIVNIVSNTVRFYGNTTQHSFNFSGGNGAI